MRLIAPVASCVSVRACVRACVRVYVRAYVSVCFRTSHEVDMSDEHAAEPETHAIPRRAESRRPSRRADSHRAKTSERPLAPWYAPLTPS